MTTALRTVQFTVDFGNNRSANFEVQGARYFYGDADITGAIGAEIKDEGDIVPGAITAKTSYQRFLVPMVAVLGADGPAGTGNAAQSRRTRTFRFWCNPDHVGEAFRGLPGKAVDSSLLPGDWEITRVYLPVDSNLA